MHSKIFNWIFISTICAVLEHVCSCIYTYTVDGVVSEGVIIFLCFECLNLVYQTCQLSSGILEMSQC